VAAPKPPEPAEPAGPDRSTPGGAKFLRRNKGETRKNNPPSIQRAGAPACHRKAPAMRPCIPFGRETIVRSKSCGPPAGESGGRNPAARRLTWPSLAISLDLTGRRRRHRGGEVGEQKARALLEAGAAVTVIAERSAPA